MNKINVCLLGTPTVFLNNNQIYFPYRKAEGLFYYICINKSCTREELISILWGEYDETKAKKNLRDAIYKIRRLLGDDIFNIIGKSTVQLNTNTNIDIDTDHVDSSNILNLYNSDFLSNFFIKDSYEFEEWAAEKKEYYKNMYLNAIKNKLHEMVNMGDLKRIEFYSDILIKNDPYNEKVYRDVMRIYALSGNYNMSVKLYHDLKKVLKDELDVEPEIATKNILSQILKLKQESSENDKQDYFYGRFQEMYLINNYITSTKSDTSTSVFIKGEAGIGKSALLSRIVSSIDNKKFAVFKSACFKDEKNFYLKPLYSIFSQIGSFITKENINVDTIQIQLINYVFPNFMPSNTSILESSEIIDTTRFKTAMEAIIKILDRITIYKKIILVIDDIQWIDEMSKILLNNILSSIPSNRLVLLTAYRDDFESQISTFTVPLISKSLATEIKLNRFTLDETKVIVSSLIPELDSNNELVNKIYKDTEGNALFLIELLKAVKTNGYTKDMSAKSVNIIKSRLLDLTKEEYNVISAISMYFDKVSIDGLQIILTIKELDIFYILESLQERHLIVETIADNNIFYSFSHQKIRDYVYNSISIGRREALHRKIAEYFQHIYNENKSPQLISTLLYHFKGCRDNFNTLKYKVEYYKEFLTICNETFPVVSSDINVNNLIDGYANLEDDLVKTANEIVKINRNDDEFNKINMEMSYILGRYYISNGNYDEGLKNVKKSIELAKTLKNTEYLLVNYKQMIFYSIQIHNMLTMKNYINKSYELLKEYKNEVEDGTILRLDGLYYIKIKNYDKAKELLDKSIDIFNKLSKDNNKYILSIAACYNYMGLIYKYQDNYDLAYEYFDKAIEICSSEMYSSGIGIFYSNAGQALYNMHQLDKSNDYINKSIDYFKMNNSLWGRDISEIYASMIALDKKDKNKALLHYNNSISICEKIANPTSLSLLDKLKDRLKKEGVC